MTLPILAATAKEADPRRNYRMRDFLETLGLRPTFVPEPGPEPVKDEAPAAEAPAEEAPEAEAGSEDEAANAPECAICEGPHQDGMYHGPLAPPAPYGHPSIADAVAAKDEPAEAEAEAGGS